MRQCSFCRVLLNFLLKLLILMEFFISLELTQYEGRDGGDPSTVRVMAAFPEDLEARAPSVFQAISEAVGGTDGVLLQELREKFIFIELDSESVALDEAYFDVLTSVLSPTFATDFLLDMVGRGRVDGGG